LHYLRLGDHHKPAASFRFWADHCQWEIVWSAAVLQAKNEEAKIDLGEMYVHKIIQSVLWRTLAFIFGLAGTIVTSVAVDDGNDLAYGIDSPRRGMTVGP